MSELPDLNIVKEGDMYNVVDRETTLAKQALSPAEFVSLYSLSGLIGITGTLLSGTEVAFEVHWGETYDISSVHYYHDSPTSSGISISCGLSSGVEAPIPFVTVSGGSHTGYVGDARFLRVIHSVSHGHVFHSTGLYVGGVRNTQLSFGTVSPAGAATLVGPAPTGYLGLATTEVPVINTYDSPVDIKVSLVPTGSDADQYVYLSTTSSGSYYGLNDHGVFVPATQKITLTSDTLLFSSAEEMRERWTVLEGGMQGRVIPSSDGVSVRTATGYALVYTGDIASTLFGLLSKEAFTGDQSFTIKVKVRVPRVTNYFVHGVEFVFGFSNNMPIPAISYNEGWPCIDERFLDRAGRSGACLSFISPSAVGTSSRYAFLYGDGRLTQFKGSFGQPSMMEYAWDTAGIYTHESFGVITGGSAGSNADWTSEAVFRQLTITWDHVDRVASGYIDGVFIGEHRFVYIPQNGIHIFMLLATNMNSSADLFFKDFEIYTDRLYKQRGLSSTGLLSAAANRSADPGYHGASKLVDFTDTEWLGGYYPQPNDWMEVFTDIPRDIVGVRVTNPGPLAVTNVSGSLTAYPQYLLKTVYFQPSTGSPLFREIPTTAGAASLFRLVDGNTGYPTTLSGVTSVRATFVDMHGPISVYGDPCVAVREFDLIEEYYDPVLINKLPPASGTVPWSAGSFRNLKQPGYDGSLVLDSQAVYEVALVLDTELLVRGVDYDVSNSFVWTSTTGYEHGGEQTIFRSCGCAAEHGSSVAGMWSYSVPASVWRRFGSSRRIKAVYAFWGSGQNVHALLGLINRFKVQFLRPGCSVSDEASWEDIPVISVPYTGASAGYTTYRQFFIDNNDGEFYTNVAFSYRLCPGMPTTAWPLPTDTVLKKDWRWSADTVVGDVYIAGDCDMHLSSSLYLEFDEAVTTEAIRFVIDECLNESRTAPVTAMNLFTLAMFSDVVYGEYTSPVLDTGSNLNTERIVASVRTSATTSGVVYVRSSEQPPVHQHNYNHLFWQPWVIPLKDTVFDVETGIAGISGWTHYLQWPKHGLTVGKRVYIMPTVAGFPPIYYEYSTGDWGVLPVLGPTAENIRASSTIYNHAVLTESGIMYVAVEVGDQNTSRFMRYDFEEDQYGISGWRSLSVNRPPEVTTGGMVSYGEQLYLFGQGGQTVVFDPVSCRWDPTLAPMPLHDLPYRYDFWPLRYKDSVFIFGGSSTYGTPVGFIDRYDISADRWDTVDFFRFFVGGRVYALNVGNLALILSACGGVHAVFDLDTGRVVHDVVPPLSMSNFIHPRYGFAASVAWAYGEEVVAFDDAHILGTGGFGRKTRLVGTPWEHGKIPALYDEQWGVGGVSALPWKPLTVSSETMPQERYVQFKVVLETTASGLEPPAVEKLSVITPQTLARVNPGDSAPVFIKTGVAVTSSYEIYYSGATAFQWKGFGWSLYRVTSADGQTLSSSTRVLETTDSGTYQLSFPHSCVVRYAPSEYVLWGTRARYAYSYPYAAEDPYFPCISGSIFRAASSDGVHWGGDEEIIPVGYQGVYDTAGSYYCSVIGDLLSGYVMWYTGIQLGTGYGRILRSTSTDGVSWTAPTLAIDKDNSHLFGVDAAGVFSPTVVYDASAARFFIWYAAKNSLGASSIVVASSGDGVVWGDFVSVRIPASSYATRSSDFPSVIKDVDTFKMWFVGTDHLFERRLLYTSSQDGVLWATPVLVMSRGLCGTDSDGLGPVSIVNNRALVVPAKYVSGARLKVYNG